VEGILLSFLASSPFLAAALVSISIALIEHERLATFNLLREGCVFLDFLLHLQVRKQVILRRFLLRNLLFQRHELLLEVADFTIK